MIENPSSPWLMAHLHWSKARTVRKRNLRYFASLIFNVVFYFAEKTSMSPSLSTSVNKLYGVHIVQRKRIGTYPFRRMSARARFLRGVTGHWIPTSHTVLWSLILVKVRVCNVISTRTWCLQNRNKENFSNFSLIVSRIERLVNHPGKNDDIYVHDKRSVTLQRSTTFITMIRDT